MSAPLETGGTPFPRYEVLLILGEAPPREKYPRHDFLLRIARKSGADLIAEALAPAAPVKTTILTAGDPDGEAELYRKASETLAPFCRNTVWVRHYNPQPEGVLLLGFLLKRASIRPGIRGIKRPAPLPLLVLSGLNRALLPPVMVPSSDAVYHFRGAPTGQFWLVSGARHPALRVAAETGAATLRDVAGRMGAVTEIECADFHALDSDEMVQEAITEAKGAWLPA